LTIGRVRLVGEITTRGQCYKLFMAVSYAFS